jgi:hypothetical protein
MLGTSCVLLPTQLNQPLTEETLSVLASELQKHGFGIEQTSLALPRLNQE